MVALAAMALSHPIHTADCERSFSAQNRVASSLRNRLMTEHCDQLMRVMTEGGKLGEYDFQLGLSKWWNVKDCVIFRSVKQ